MASSTFEQILKKELGSKYSRRASTQTADILHEAEMKKMSLASTFKFRAERGLAPEDIADFEEAASEYVDNILELAVDEDIERLANQRTFRAKGRSKTPVKSAGMLIDRRNRQISPQNLERLLNLTLYNYAKDLMDTRGRLENQSGRLAHSGAVTKIEENPKARRVSFYFTYMLYPYQVFESGPKSNGGRRDPAKLFKEAIHMALDRFLKPGTLPRGERMRFMYFRGERT